MPQAIAVIGVLIIDALGAFTLSTAFYVVAYAAVVYALNSAYQSLTRRKPGGAPSEGRGLEVAINDTGQGGFAIYGKVKVNGVNVIPPITGGDKGRYLEQILAHTLHEVDGYENVFFDDLLIRNSDIDLIIGNSNDGRILSGKYIAAAWIRRYTGTVSQTVDYILNTRYPTVFTSDFRGRGIAYTALTYDWVDGRLYSNLPIVTEEIRGKKCYDPRLDSVPGLQPTNSAYAAWTSNPALCWADYLLADYGGAMDGSEVDWQSVVDAANICDALVLGGPQLSGIAAEGAASFNATTRVLSGGTGAWGGAGAASTGGFTKGYVSARANNTTSDVMFGLSTSSADSSYNTIAYAFYFTSTNTIQIYEFGSLQGTFAASYTTGTVLKIVYDGRYMHYYINEVLVRSVAVPTEGASYKFDAACFSASSNITLEVEKRYTFNARIYLPMESDWRENAKTMVDAMMGRMTRLNGKWYCYAGAWDTPAYNLTKLDWLSIDSIKTVAPRDGGRWNSVSVWYVDPFRNWQREECFRRRNSTYRAADGNEEITLEMEQPGCTDEWEAQRKGEMLLKQSRNQIAIAGKLGPQHRRITAGTTVTHDFEELGWSQKTFRCRRSVPSPDGSMDVVLVEEQQADWDDLTSAQFNTASTAPIPSINPTTPSEPSSFNIDALTVAGTLRFRIGIPAVRPIGTRYQVIRGNVSTNAAVGTVFYEGDMTDFSMPAPSSAGYYWARAFANSYYGPYQPNTTGILVGPLLWSWQQNNAITTSYAVTNNEVVGYTRFTPDAAGRLQIIAQTEGKASFDRDSGTFFILCCGPTASVNTALGVVQFSVASFDSGAYAYFSSNSIWQPVTLTAQFDVSSGVDYTYGVHVYRALGSIAFRAVNVNHLFVRN